jgi:hypothetical protein
LDDQSEKSCKAQIALDVIELSSGGIAFMKGPITIAAMLYLLRSVTLYLWVRGIVAINLWA